jgi:hypothetical protein
MASPTFLCGIARDAKSSRLTLAPALEQIKNVSSGYRVAGIMSTPASKSVVDELRQRIQRLAGARSHGRDVLPFGIDVIDRVLPGGGLTLGALHEA